MKRFTYESEEGEKIVVHGVDARAAREARDKIIDQYFPGRKKTSWNLKEVKE